jgi:hypothetical protein
MVCAIKLPDELVMARTIISNERTNCGH